VQFSSFLGRIYQFENSFNFSALAPSLELALKYSNFETLPDRQNPAQFVFASSDQPSMSEK
jgi:hypothetical protein